MFLVFFHLKTQEGVQNLLVLCFGDLGYIFVMVLFLTLKALTVYQGEITHFPLYIKHLINKGLNYTNMEHLSS